MYVKNQDIDCTCNGKKNVERLEVLKKLFEIHNSDYIWLSE